MAKYNKISNKTKGEIKRAYEAGVDLIDISLKYMVNYGTLKNISSKEQWQKGKSKSIMQQAIIEDDISKRVELRDQVIGHYQNLHQSNLSYLMELERTGERPVIKSREEALKNRIMATTELYKLAKELFSIQTPMEKVEYELKQIKYEVGKRAIKDGVGVMFLSDKEDE
jgi:hypothetical protein